MTSLTDEPLAGQPSTTDERIGAILAASHELAEYRAWLAAGRPNPTAPRDYLFTRDVARFEPRRGDVPTVAPGLHVTSSDGVTRLVCPSPKVAIPVPELTAAEAERLIGAMDGERCLAEVVWDAAVEAPTAARLLRAAFGRVIFAPAAVSELEGQLRGAELCRFPSSPYAIERPYWENMIGVRERFVARATDAVTGPTLVPLLRELHVVALLGPSLESFYRPASPGAERAAPPGALLLDASRLRPGRSCAVFLSGPRVNASLVGGRRYHEKLASSVGDPAALDDSRAIQCDGLDWGAVTRARGEADRAPGAWFCPPRPLADEHFEWLASALRDAGAATATAPSPSRRSDPRGTVRAVARWHWGMVRLHPFHCANQSLAMNLANALLQAAVGVGIPHLLLDQLALRLGLDAYQRLFARAVRHWAIDEPEPSRRLTRLLELRARLFARLEEPGTDAGGTPPASHDAADDGAALLVD